MLIIITIILTSTIGVNHMIIILFIYFFAVYNYIIVQYDNVSNIYYMILSNF